MLRAVLLALVATLLAGCGDSAPDAETTTGGSTTAPRATDLVGRSFAGTDARGRTLVAGSEVTIEFDAKRLHAKAGCNGLVGAWAVAGVEAPVLLITKDGNAELFAGCNRGGGHAQVREDGFVVFGPLALTRKACERDAAQVEAAVLAALHGEVAAAFDGEGNLVLARKGAHLTFAPTG